VSFDNFFPFDSGAGATASAARWDSMAKWFIPPGVIVGAYNQLSASLSGTTLTLQSGAVWIQGVYGEDTTTHTVTVTANGLVCARLDTVAQVIEMYYNTSAYTLTQTSTTYDIPLYAIISGSLVDWRQWTGNGVENPGTVTEWTGTTPPLGAIFSYGQTVSRTQYARLYAVMGTSNGSGDGSTTFGLPDYRGRVSMAPDNMGGTAANRSTEVSGLGATGGLSTVTLTIPQIPGHTHADVDSGHGHGNNNAAHSHAMGNHTHTPAGGQYMQTYSPSSIYFHNAGPGADEQVTYGNPPYMDNVGGVSTYAASPGITVNTGYANIVPGSTGGGTSHENLPPFVAVNKVIWY
jgi:microcystin-dependent protein